MRLAVVNLRSQPFAVRLALLVVAAVVGVIVGYCLGLVWIAAEVAIVGHADAHTWRGFIAVGIAYGITGLTALAIAFLTWRGLFR